MNFWWFFLWGSTGGFAVIGLEVVGDIRKHGRIPWGKGGKIQTGAFFLAAILRIGIGGILAAVTGLGGVVSGVFGAFGAGVAAPLVIEKLGESYKSIAGKPDDPGTLLDDSQLENSDDAPPSTDSEEKISGDTAPPDVKPSQSNPDGDNADGNDEPEER